MISDQSLLLSTIVLNDTCLHNVYGMLWSNCLLIITNRAEESKKPGFI